MRNFCTIYTVRDIIGAIIEFLFDPVTGTQPAAEVINTLKEEGKAGDQDKLQLFKLVQRGLEFLEHHGIPETTRTYFTTNREDGRPYTILLTKYLQDHVPLLEFRVNWQGTGAFRATFFEYPHPKTRAQILLFVRAVIKQQTYDPDFERIAAESDRIYADFIQDPEKYISFSKE